MVLTTDLMLHTIESMISTAKTMLPINESLMGSIVWVFQTVGGVGGGVSPLVFSK